MKIPLKLTRSEANAISATLALIPELTRALAHAEKTIDYMTTMARPSGDRVIQGFSAQNNFKTVAR